MLIRQQVFARLFSRLACSRNGLHLLSADDSALFFHVDATNAKSILDILNHYEEVSR